MKDILDLIISLLTALTLLSGLIFAIYRFGLKRERFSFLKMDVDTNIITAPGEVQLVSIIIKLENKGATRIDARRQQRTDGYLYNDGRDQCAHAGTLKIRPVPVVTTPLYFDWYSLKPMSSLIQRVGMMPSEGDLEQINYLDEYEDPEGSFKEVDFCLDPKESCELNVSIWLRPGIYAAKAVFLGPRVKHTEEEYWSRTILFQVDPFPHSEATGAWS